MDSCEVSWRIFMVDRCPSNAPARCGLENMPLTTIKHLGFCWTSDDSAPKTENRPALCMPLIPQFQNDLKVKHLYFKADACEVVAVVAAAAVVFVIVVWSVAAKKKKAQKKHNKCWERSWPYLVGKIWVRWTKVQEKRGRTQRQE